MASLGEQALTALGVEFVSHVYDYRKKGAAEAAASIGAPRSALLKTLVLRLADGGFALLLMPGDREATLGGLARVLETKRVALASERDAERITGYRTGGIGPFGTRDALPVYVDISACGSDKVFVNGGRRGLIVELALDDMLAACQAELVDVSVEQ